MYVNYYLSINYAVSALCYQHVQKWKVAFRLIQLQVNLRLKGFVNNYNVNLKDAGGQTLLHHYVTIHCFFQYNTDCADWARKCIRESQTAMLLSETFTFLNSVHAYVTIKDYNGQRIFDLLETADFYNVKNLFLETRKEIIPYFLYRRSYL